MHRDNADTTKRVAVLLEQMQAKKAADKKKDLQDSYDKQWKLVQEAEDRSKSDEVQTGLGELVQTLVTELNTIGQELGKGDPFLSTICIFDI